MQTVYLLTLDDMEFLKKNLTEIQMILDALTKREAIPESYAKSSIRRNLDNFKMVLEERRPYL